MGQVTKKGRELAEKLGPSIGISGEIVQTCSLICRHATTHNRLQVIHCNRGLSKAEERKEEQIEARIKALVEELPHVDGKPIVPKFGGDPRGFTVKLVMPDGRYDTWGGAEDGFGVPQGEF
jgi:hypothetical protein